jgi:hypothetical protein
MRLEYDYDQDPRYGWHTLRVEEGDGKLIELIVDGADGGTLATYSLDTTTGEFKPVCMCNAWNESECACGNY